MEIEQSTTPAGRITLDDVRLALGETNPNDTNAAKVRAVLGRGSYDTIQRHLGTLRAELAAALQPIAIDSVPPVPGELAQQLWAAAWAAAQVAAHSRTTRLSDERDAAMRRALALEQDVAGLVATVDAQGDQIVMTASAGAEAGARHLAALDAATAATAAAQTKADELALALDRANADAAHAAALAEAGRLAMQAAMDRLIDQVGELKAHLYKRVDSQGGN